MNNSTNRFFPKMGPLSILLFLSAFSSTIATAQINKPTLVKDIKAGTAASNPVGFTQLNNKVYFTASGDFNSIYTDSDRRVYSMANGAAVPQTLPTNIGNRKGFSAQKPYLLNNELFLLVGRSDRTDTITELWKTNGTTETFVDTLPLSSYSSVYNNKLYTNKYYAPIGGRRSIDLYRHSGVKGSSQFIAKTLREDTLPTGSFFNYWRERADFYYPTPDVTFTDFTLDSTNSTNLRGFRRTIRAFDHTTGLTKDIYTVNWRGNFGSSTDPLTNYKVVGAVNSKLLFVSTETNTNNVLGDTLFSLDKTGAKTIVQIGVGSPSRVLNLGNRIVYLDAYLRIWDTDGTTATRRLTAPNQGLISDIYYANGQIFYLISNTVYVPTIRTVNRIFVVGGGEVGSFENTEIDQNQLVVYKDNKDLFFLQQKTEVDTSRRILYKVGDTAAPFKEIGLVSKCKRDPFGDVPRIAADTTCPCLGVTNAEAQFTVIDSTLLFVAFDKIYGNEVWRMNLNAPIAPPNPCATDTVKPVFANCPQNINVVTTLPTAIATWTPPTATDNCGTPSVSSTYNSGFAFSVGTTAVVYTAKDALNNTAACRFNVIVTATPPVANCASASQAPWNEWIANVAFGTFANASEKTRPERYSVGYSDFKDKINNVQRGQTYPLSITPGLSYPSYQTNLFFRAWIDFNGNNIFEDTEKILEQNNGNQLVTSSVTIPTTALLGARTMRVSMKKGAYPTACETFPAGEVEDYTVQIADGSTTSCANDVTPPVFANCPANISLTTTTTTAIATWTAPTATDNCTATPSVSSNFLSGFAFPIGTTNVVYTAKDALNNAQTCTFSVTVSLQNTGGGANDIGLSITSSPSVYRQWTPITVRVSAKNNGTTAMTNVKIELKRPAKTASGGAKTPSIGTFNDYCAGGIECAEWVIPNLAGGATATLDAPFFVLDATLPIVVTTNLLTSTPTDATAANNTASVSIAPQIAAAIAAQLAYQKPTQLIPIIVQRIAPNPTEGELILKLESLDAREVTFSFFNALGKLVKTEKKTVEKGVNHVEFDVFELEQGVHFIVPSTMEGYKVPTKFVKM